MLLLTALLTFNDDESGAVTVDWVVLTAAIVGLGFIAIGTASQGIMGASVNVASSIESYQAAATNLNR